MSIEFNPPSVNCGVAAPGRTSTASTSCNPVSVPANVTAYIEYPKPYVPYFYVHLARFILEEVQLNDVGDPAPGKKPKIVETETAVQTGASEWALLGGIITSLGVPEGQYLTANIQFAPTESSPDICEATLHFEADAWPPIAPIPIVGYVSEYSLSFLPPLSEVSPGASGGTDFQVTLLQGTSQTVDVVTTLIKGLPRRFSLLKSSSFLTSSAPNVTFDLEEPTFFELQNPGDFNVRKLTIAADSTLAPGAYVWNFAVWSAVHGCSDSASYTFVIEVKAAHK